MLPLGVRLRMHCLVWIAVVVTMAQAGYTEVGVLNGAIGAPSTLRVLEQDTSRFFPVSAVAEVVGFSWRWDMATQRLICSGAADTVTFSQGVSFCLTNGQVTPLALPPLRHGGDLYLPLRSLTDVFVPLIGRDLRWSENEDAIGLYESAFTIMSLVCARESTSTSIRVPLAGQTSVKCTYAPPEVFVDFEGATVDPETVVGTAPCGVIDSVGVRQTDGAVRLTVRLSAAIDSTEVHSWGDGGGVDIVLHELGRTGPIPDSVLFKGGFSDTIATVVIDPGHGGKDPGAIGPGGTMEKDVVLSVALLLRDKLREEAELNVYLTRETDEFIPLRERTQFANEKGADVFVSIHADAIGGSEIRRKSVKGYKVYFLSHAKNEEDKLVAMRENAVVELEDAPEESNYLHSIITEMINNEYLRESQDLSIMLAETFGGSFKKVSKLHTGVGQANFYVLNGAFMPSVLIEMGFISNPTEERILISKDFQQDMADAICAAITGFKRKYGEGL